MTKYVVAELIDCDGIELNGSSPYERCALLNMVAQSPCNGCQKDGTRLGDLTPVKHIDGCHGDEWRLLRKSERA